MAQSKEIITGLHIIDQRVFYDNRGYFFESFNQKRFEKIITHKIQFVQDNESKSIKGAIRGLHYQTGDYAQSKLVRVTKGKVFDVAVDLRKNSKTFGQWYGIVLSEENKKQFFIPKGFAHGFQVLSDEAIFAYKCDQFYNKESEAGIVFNDKSLNISWPLDSVIVSQKDTQLPIFTNAKL